MRSVYGPAQIPGIVAFVIVLGIPCWSGQLAPQQVAAETHRPAETEDWSSLSVTNSLHAERPIFGEKDDEPLFTRELLRVKWRRGDPIDLYVIKPKGVSKPPVILYVYGYPSETDRFRDNRYCARITSGGFAAVGFVSALTGQRYQNRPMKQWFVSELQESLGSSVHDVQMILNYLASRDDVDLSNAGIFGEGSGGTIAILAAAADDRIKAIDVLDPWGDWPDWMAGSALIPEEERPSYQKPGFLEKVAPLDPVLWLPRLHSQHIRIQQLMDDPVTPGRAKERIDSVAPTSAQLTRYQGNLQLYTASSGGRLFQWIKDQLRSGKEPQPPTASLEKSQSPEKQAPGAHP